MTLYSEWKTERAEAYLILSQFFLAPPDEEALAAIRQDFSLESKDPYDEIEDDFYFLFPSPGGLLQPIESMFAQSTNIPYDDVTRLYADTGVTIDEDYDVVPDHLSVELLFMSYLIENGKTDRENQFLAEHIMNWVPPYCDEVIKQAKTAFYREIAEIVKDFLTAEYDEYSE